MPPCRRSIVPVALALILLAALGLRLVGVGFGLPALHDPDEPIFVLIALDLIKNGTLNPGWFGHPGTTTIYAQAAVQALAFGWGRLTGAWADTAGFAAALHEDPAIVILPGRLFIVACGVGGVALTYAVARRLSGAAAGLIAAALVALSPLHVAWSQVIRTDVHASLFMLAAVLASIGLAKHGRGRDAVLAGLAVGFACGTKWPGAAALAAVLGAAAHYGAATGEWGRGWRLAGAGVAAAMVGLFLASPWLFLEWRTVVADLSGEAKAAHLSHTGGGTFANLRWLVAGPILGSFGALAGLAMLPGLWSVLRDRLAAAVLLPPALVFVIAIASQTVIFDRWAVPLVPFLAILAGLGAVTAWRAAARVPGPAMRAAGAAALVLALVPALGATRRVLAERLSDTRSLASEWATRHIPPGSSVVVEHVALDLLPRPWTIRFPMAELGCVDGKALVRGQTHYKRVQKARNGRTIVDLGTVKPERLASCRADYAILSHYDRYLAEGGRYPAEIASYRALTRGGRTLAVFRPETGRTGGPVVRIVRLAAGA